MSDQQIQSLAYKVVGHRGFPEKYPENSLIGLEAAAKLGAHCVELDVQMSKDGIPIVFHDPTLDRVCGIEGRVWDFTLEELAGISNHEPARFGEQYIQLSKIAPLEEVAKTLAKYASFVFVEIKKESFEAFSREQILNAVMTAVEPIKSHCAIISFDFEIVQMAQQQHEIVGWVLSNMQQSTLLKAQMLKPNILAYDVKKLSSGGGLWPGPWDWFLWDIVDPAQALVWASNGVSYIETWDAAKLMSSLVE